MKKIHFILLPLAILLFSRCEQVIEVDLPQQEPVLVVNGKIVPDSLFRVGITASQPSTSNDDPKAILDATVVVERQGQVLDTLHHTLGGYYQGSSNNLPVSGQTYTIKASAAGYETVQGTETLPIPIAIAQLSWQDSIRPGLNGAMIGEINLSFDDPAADENYYMIFVVKTDTAIWGPDTFYFHNPVTPEVQDPGVVNNFVSGAILLDDVSFNGQRKTLKLGLEIGQDHSKMSVVLLTCSKNYFLYSRTMYAAFEVEGNPFAEPIIVHSNMSSKMGIFAGYSQVWQHLQ